MRLRGRFLARYYRTTGLTDRPFRWRDAALLLVLFGFLDLLFCGILDPIESAIGLPLKLDDGPAVASNLRDAVWHLATAFLLVLPLGERRLLVLGPLLSLGLDIDHVFGTYLPEPFARMAHNVIFLALATLALFFFLGRYAAFASAAAILTHLAVDGGDFPLFAPFTAARFSLPYPVELGLVAAATLLFFLAVRPIGDLVKPRWVVPPAAAAVVLAVVLALLAPGFSAFTSA